MMDYDHKVIDMQQYYPFIGDLIVRLQKCQDEKFHTKNEEIIKILQKLHGSLQAGSKNRMNVETLRKFEDLVKKIQPIYVEHCMTKKSTPKASTSKRSFNGPQHRRKHHDETPASPSPPNTPMYSSSMPIHIPGERIFQSNVSERRYRNESPPPMNRFARPRSPELPKMVPIPISNIDEEGPLEWDLEENSPQEKTRPEIVVAPRSTDVSAAAKKLSDKFSRDRDYRGERNDRYDHRDRDTDRDYGRYDPKDRYDREPNKPRYAEPPKERYDNNRRYGSYTSKNDSRDEPPQNNRYNSRNCDNVPTLEVPSLEGSRRISSVIERNKLLQHETISRVFPDILDSPDINAPDEGLHSPDDRFMNDSPSPPRPHNRDPRPPPLPPPQLSPSKPAPPPPSLLLHTPAMAKPPISVDDLAEYLPKRPAALQMPDMGRYAPPKPISQPITSSRPLSRMGLPGSSPNIMSPISDHNSPSPLNDPRTAPPTDPRLRGHSAVPTPVPPPSAPVDPRTQPRIADSYERFKRTQTQPPQSQQAMTPMYTPPPNPFAAPMEYQNNVQPQSWANPTSIYPAAAYQMPMYQQQQQAVPQQQQQQQPRGVVPPLMNNYNQYPNMYQQPQETITRPYEDQFQRPRTAQTPNPWSNNANVRPQGDAFNRQNNISTPFSRPPVVNNKDANKNSRDPRDPRDPRSDLRQVKSVTKEPPAPPAKALNKDLPASSKSLSKTSEKDRSTKEKDRHRNRDRSTPPKSSGKDKVTEKSKSTTKPLVYGAVNAKTGFNNFKIPKKKMSQDAEPEDMDSQDSEVPPEAPPPEKDKEKSKEKKKKKDQDTSDKNENDNDLEFLVECLRKNGKTEAHIRKFIDAYAAMNQGNANESEKSKGNDKDNDKDQEKSSSEDEIRRVSSKTKKHKKKVISDDSDDSNTEAPAAEEKKKKRRSRSKAPEPAKNTDTSDVEKAKTRPSRRKAKEVVEKRLSKESSASEMHSEGEFQVPQPVQVGKEGDHRITRSNRELEMLHKDLDSSFIRDSIESYSNKRQCNSRRINLNEDALLEQNQGRKTRGKRNVGKGASKKSSNDNFECILDDNSNPHGSDDESASNASTGRGRRTGKSAIDDKIFDESSNDDLSLDPSVMETATDISLHPNPKKSSKTSGRKTPAPDAAAESSESDTDSNTEETASVASSRNMDEQEHMEAIIENMNRKARAAASGGRGRGKKKKRNSWRLGIARKKKTTAKKPGAAATSQNKDDESTSNAPAVTQPQETPEPETEEAANEDSDILTKVDLNALVAYTQSSDQDKYQCLLCGLFLKNIVHHYKTAHRNREVLIARLPIAAAGAAINEANALDLINKTDDDEPASEFVKYTCRFCQTVFKNLSTGAKEHFYEHCTNHTGEYRFSCRNCAYASVTKTSIRSHYYKGCRKPGTSTIGESTQEDAIPSVSRVYGYICTKCNFVQLKRSNVERHMKTWHSEDPSAKIVKISMSMDLKDEEEELEPGISIKAETKTEVKDELNNSQEAMDTSASDIRVVMESVCAVEKTEDNKPAGNLSAFVVPPDLENKEAEIQMERRKKMREIAENIGIMNKDEVDKTRVSVADKLKDKIVQQDSENQAQKERRIPRVVVDPVQVKDEPPQRKDTGDQETRKSPNRKKTPTSEADESDQEMAPLQFDSDSTSESEAAQSANNRLEDISNDQSTVNTTIEKLRARMQEGSITVKTEATTPEKRKIGDNDDENSEFRPPAKIKKENDDENEEAGKEDDKDKDADSAPRIRIRRFSGDRFGGDGENEPNKESSSKESTPNETSAVGQDNDGGLKIASVVSLAPQGDQDNTMEAKKSVETSPVRSKGQSILKKQSPFLLKDGGTIKLISLNVAPGLSKTATSIITTQPTTTGSVTLRLDPNISIPINVSGGGATPTSLVNALGQPLKLVKLPESVVGIKLKSKNVYEKMLQDDKLIHLFKCMGRECCFTSSVEQAFNKHIRIHEDSFDNLNNDQPKDFYKCAYCYSDCKNYEDLTNHLKKMHTFCRYCCKYCFYRALNPIYVEIHQKIHHFGQKINILTIKEELVHKTPPLPVVDRKQIIKPYVCVHGKRPDGVNECNKYFFIPEAFVLHLSLHHKNITNNFRCHICTSVSTSVDNLIEHYKRHDCCKYHCMYCLHGGSTVKELHTHMSAVHYNLPAEILERCLPKEIMKNISAIDQLKIINLDQVYQQQKEEEQRQNASGPGSMVVSPITRSGSKIAIVPARGFTTLASLRPNNVDGNLSIRIGDTTSNVRVVDPRNLGSVNVISSGGEMPDEFVSINLLDNPDILKAKTPSVTNSQAVLTKIAPAKDDNDHDSDIEIIEDFNTSNNSVKNTITTKVEKEDTEESDTGDVTLNSEQSFAEEISTTTSVGNNGRPLTLEDIKNTGCSGPSLYRCGIQTCVYRAETSDELKSHLCTCFNERDTLYCKVCEKRPFLKISSYLEHLKSHGLKRFSCSICEARFAQQTAAQTHIRLKHLIKSYKVVHADPKNPSVDGLFVVQPMSDAVRLKSKKAKANAEKESPKTAEIIEKTTYAPDEVDSLPYQAIYNRAIQCAVCSYSNKVRTNIVRHLQMHAKDESSVPETGPVNPVPCLEKKEKMFDKMVNLASSSHQNGRMGGAKSEIVKKSDDDESFLPKYVPEHQRYVCGVAECNYLSVDETMLRYHLKALHSDEIYFRCPHCPPPNGQEIQNIAIEKMGIHLKMHDSRLYKCTYCNYHHCHRHVVERHLADKHSEKRPFVKVIREIEVVEQSNVFEAEEEPQVPPLANDDGNVWKCNMCDFKSLKKCDVATHASSKHNEKYQYKCNLCAFRSIGKYTFETHLSTHHPSDINPDYTVIYERIHHAPKIVTEQSFQDEPFDTTPLWRRDMPRIRHIRGILLEDEDGRISEHAPKAGKRKSDVESSPTKPGKVRTKSGSLDDPNSKLPESKKAKTDTETSKKPPAKDINVEEIVMNDDFGQPNGDLYTCNFCKHIQTRYKQDIRDHLFRELKYHKWPCTLCEFKTVNRSLLIKHFHTRHPQMEFDAIPIVDEDKENWVAAYLKAQGDTMKSLKSEVKIEAAVEEPASEKESNLVIDEGNDNAGESIPEPDGEKDTSAETSYQCKHCTKSFNNIAGFKRHVTVKHSRGLAYQCPYCDRTSNQEHIILSHLSSQHKDKPCIVKKASNAPNRNTEFFEEEYGPKSLKKRKREPSPAPQSTSAPETPPSAPVIVKSEPYVEPAESVSVKQQQQQPMVPADMSCRRCGFEAANLAALRVHSQSHAVRVRQQCTLCGFKTCEVSEMRQHWDINHAGKVFSVEEAVLLQQESSSAGGPGAKKKLKTEGGDDAKKIMIYSCFYCQQANISVEGIRRHWQETHRPHHAECTVFRYIEDPDIEAKCAYCAEAGTKSVLAAHINRHHQDKELRFVDCDGDGWQCQLCKAFLSDRAEISLHQSSHHPGQKTSCRLVTKGYQCTQCKFQTFSTEVMRNHVTTYHMLIYHCQICPKRFSVQGEINIHYRKEHPGVEPNYRRDIKEDVIHQEIEDAMIRSERITEPVLRTQDPLTFAATQRRLLPGVAKKSTTKQVKSVARKSTSYNTFAKPRPKIEYVSHYGRPRSPVDLASIKTSLPLGTGKVTVSCDRLAHMFDIECQVQLEDISKKINT